MSTSVFVDNTTSCNWSDIGVTALELSLSTPSRAAVRKWPQELKDKRKMELHSKRMTRFRNKKITESKSMHHEHRRLERELEYRIGELRRTGVGHIKGVSHVQRELQRLVLEREDLREERMVLRQEITQCLKFQQVIQCASDKLIVEEDLPADGGEQAAVTVRYVDSKWQPVQEQAGRWVHFTNGKPPFFFYPFSRHEVDTVIRLHDIKVSTVSEHLILYGKFLGWSVYHGTELHWHIDRFNKRVEHSFDALLSGMYRDDGTWHWPIMPTARDIGGTAEIDIQKLQKLDDNSSVLTRSYTGDYNLRYMGVVHRSQVQVQGDGKSVIKFYYVVADSQANARSRAADPTSQDDVYWITDERGFTLTLTEVDDTSVDVSFTSLACLSSELNALHHFLLFGRIVTRWEQLTMSSNLLTF